MDAWLGAFALGNAAILTNVCLLPLYPGLIAYLAGTAQGARRAGPWLGLLVLLGVLALMTGVALLLYGFRQPFAAVLPWLLPVIYGAVILLGLLMLAGVNPFYRLAGARSPVLSNPYAGAFVYGLMLGPMTLPCTGPIVLSAFLLGAGNPGALLDGLAYFLFFGLGFGWPLVLLPLVAAPLSRRATGLLTRHAPTLTRVSGLLLVGIGVFGVVTEVLPNR